MRARFTLSRLVCFSLAALLALALCLRRGTPVSAQNSMSPSDKSATNAAQRHGDNAGGSPEVARGKYIVENLAMCGTCHSPTDSRGNPDRSRWLQGRAVPYMPSRPDSDWPVLCPRIGGTPPAADADMVKLLMTGIWTTGNRLRLPMPQFRMDKSDAEAVVAYLKSIKPQQ